jgi:hypothetical protein
MYRTVDELERDSGPLVTIRTFLDPVEAELARAKLEGCDVFALVVEPTGFNPLLTAAAGGVLLRVRESDAGRAESILGVTASDAEEDDEPEGTVRCPRCELAYCFLERPTLRSGMPTGLGFFAWMAGRFGKKRWYCHKCEHVWDDPQAGPARMTLLSPDDPRPVFRLHRAHSGMGLFIGAVGGALAGGLADLAPAFVAVPLVGWLVGRSIRRDVCSEPSCRAPLSRDAEECARCRGAVAGAISRAAEHYAEAADFRRELAALRRAPRSAPERAKRKRPRRPASA